MKVRWLLVASMFMAMFAIASVSSVSAAPGVITDEKVAVKGYGAYPFIYGSAEYKVRAGGARSFAISIRGAQVLSGQQLVVYVNASGMTGPTCTLYIGAKGAGSCYVDTRLGQTVPNIVAGVSFVDVYTVIGEIPVATAGF